MRFFLQRPRFTTREKVVAGFAAFLAVGSAGPAGLLIMAIAAGSAFAGNQVTVLADDLTKRSRRGRSILGAIETADTLASVGRTKNDAAAAKGAAALASTGVAALGIGYALGSQCNEKKWAVVRAE